MDWREHISKAYAAFSAGDDSQTTTVFREPASPAEIFDAEQRLNFPFPKSLRELLSQTNGFGEEMFIQSELTGIDLGSFFLSTTEIVECTSCFRHSGLASNIDFEEMLFVGDFHVDGIHFAIRKGEDQVFAWYPMERMFRPLASDLPSFISGWLSGDIPI
jgi:hypothetical protein